jgi:phosphoenolpyruvate synthase/pyruvate phosphate dikinase
MRIKQLVPLKRIEPQHRRERTTMKQVMVFLSSLIAAMVAGFYFHQPLLTAIFAAGAGVVLGQIVREEVKVQRAISEEIIDGDSRLRQEVIEAQKLAFSKLANAGDELKTQVAELLADAAEHLGYPYLGARLSYANDLILEWNKEGLTLIAQARQLIDSYSPTNS